MKSDIQIQQDVMDQLKRQPDLNAAAIEITAKNGIVTLTGIVDAYSGKIPLINDPELEILRKDSVYGRSR